MEPILVAEVLSPQDCLEIIYSILLRRRAHVVKEEAKGGTPFTVLTIEIPALESFGFETDLRTATVGQAMALTTFDHWTLVPGDPLDKDIALQPLEPAPVPHLARELMVKTRRRKGLMDDVSVVKFFDSKEMITMAMQDMSLKTYF
jgi:U5 small nuclear ribonucleoprotein component